MKKLKFLSALALASAAFAANAADISNPVQSLTWDSFDAEFTRDIASQNKGNTFSDKFSFTTWATGEVSGYITALGGGDKNGLAINGFSLFDSNGTQLLSGLQESSGNLDLWTFNYGNLAAGTYWVQVNGNVLGNGRADYNGGVGLALAPVPEPETYAMMLAGLGLLGFAARRKHKQNQA